MSKKTNVLLFRTTKHFHTQKFQITINNTVVDEKTSAKYLGVYLDNRLLFDEHCSHVLTRLQKSNAILAKTRHYVPKPVLRNIYFAHIQPHIDYGLSVWGNALKTHIKPVLNAQRKAVRLLAFQPKKSTGLNTHFTENKILSLRSCFQYKSGQLLWKAWHDLLPHNINNLYTKLGNHKYFQPSRRINLTQNCTSFAGVKIWNQIPMTIRMSKSPFVFKKELKKHLLANS